MDVRSPIPRSAPLRDPPSRAGALARPLVLAALALAVLLAGAVGCRTETPQAPTERPPLLFRSSVPADSTVGVHETAGLDLSITFNRDLASDDITTSVIHPRPLDRGRLRIGANADRELVLEGVVLDPEINAYRWLVDGPELLEPIRILFFPRDDEAYSPAMSGRVEIGEPGGSVDGTLVLLCGIRRDAEFRDRHDTMFGLPIEQSVFVRAGSQERSAAWRARDLEEGREYFVIGIRDTDGDGRYDLLNDWWGFHQDLEDPTKPIYVPAWYHRLDDLDPPDEVEISGVDFELVPPWTHEPHFDADVRP